MFSKSYLAWSYSCPSFLYLELSFICNLEFFPWLSTSWWFLLWHTYKGILPFVISSIYAATHYKLTCILMNFLCEYSLHMYQFCLIYSYLQYKENKSFSKKGMEHRYCYNYYIKKRTLVTIFYGNPFVSKLYILDLIFNLNFFYLYTFW